MSMKKFVSLLFASTLVFSIACGKGKEASKEDQGEDDETQTATASNTASSATAAAAPAAAPVSADAATLTGMVKFEGTAPKMPNIQMSADPYCQSQHTSAPATEQDVVTGPAGELANVFVYIKDIKGNFTAPSTPVTIDQKGCQYYPHVNAVMVGQPLQIKNDDATLHNIHAMPNVNSQFNEGQPVQGMVSTKKFDKAEITPFKVKCDVHGWMKSYMAVMPHPFYAVSQSNGSFTISNLPPGQYTVVAWHEKYGQQEQQVTVGAKESKALSFTFKG
ncbi:MAG: carboxypeptidase regulatory-like domain-containing protein [Acidobacteriota bacterium]|nr:carboxypeptidase regulatory-like domain-containing protein [Acidobacteriota bacterium]